MLNLKIAEIELMIEKSDTRIGAAEVDLEQTRKEIENLSQQKEKVEGILAKEQRKKKAAQKAILLVRKLPRTIVLTRTRLLKRMGQVECKDITVAKKEELETEITDLGLDLQKTCTHPFIYCQEGYAGDHIHEYENRRTEYRRCIVCGYSENGKRDQNDRIGTHFEILANTDNRMVESRPREGIDIWLPLGAVLKPFEERVAKILNS